MKTIYVCNLPITAEENDVYDIFEKYGEVYSVIVPEDPETEISIGEAFIEMDDANAAEAIINVNNMEYMGSIITASPSLHKYISHKPLNKKNKYKKFRFEDTV